MSKIIQSKDDKFIGFSIDKENGLTLTVPKFIEITPKDKKSKVKEFFKYYNIFKKYKTQNPGQSSVKENNHFRLYGEGVDKQNSYNFSIIELVLSLLSDYIENGLLLFRKKDTNLKQKGRINWNKTINNYSGIIANSSIIYSKFYYNNLNFTYEHPVTILHACALMNLGKLLDIKIHLPYDYRFLKTFDNSKSQKTTILKQYKREMFSDREKKVFNLLEELFLNKNKINPSVRKGKELTYVEKFDLIWEEMLKSTLKDEYKKLKKDIPKGHYVLKDLKTDNNVIFSGLTPIPDILISKEYLGKEFLFVLDAKNYVPDFKQKSGMPGSSDIIKQIFYKYFLSKKFSKVNKFEIENIINAFLLPAELDNKKIHYIGMHNIKGFEQSDIGKILCFYVDFDSLTENYLHHNSNYSEEIIDYIFNTYKHL